MLSRNPTAPSHHYETPMPTPTYCRRLKSRRAWTEIRQAVRDQTRITGLTHALYRYPARFSPRFAASCIDLLSRPGEVVLDPYMGGGTTVLEAMIRGRRAIGTDINSLSVFIARAKVTCLTSSERFGIVNWANAVEQRIRCDANAGEFAISRDRDFAPTNMTITRARSLRVIIGRALALAEDQLATERATAFARCVLLNVGQWALNGKRTPISAADFRSRIVSTTHEMLASESGLSQHLAASRHSIYRPHLVQSDAAKLPKHRLVRGVDLVVTSPPYPGIHMLYHRWQVDGRKESDAPYWIAGCEDGRGAAHYNFADRRPSSESRYYERATEAYSGIRATMNRGAIIAQLVSFSKPSRQLPKFLAAMTAAGFSELRDHSLRRIWRTVPSRKWHATMHGALPSSREVALFHAAD
jgi:DNA modification methylase